MESLLNGLDADLKLKLKEQLRDLWTHCSTALEGNSLTLGETAFVLKEGLTIAGKPLKDHQEVAGHARAIELLGALLPKGQLETSDLFELHRAVQTTDIADVYSPVGAWKREENGTYTVDEQGRQLFKYFSAPEDVPRLMSDWLARFNTLRPATAPAALDAYVFAHVSFTRVHPFFDGNGRLARLLSNLPVLRAGLPPIIISKARRFDYVRILAAYDLAVGPASAASPELLPPHPKLTEFAALAEAEWANSRQLVENAWEQQRRRAQTVK